MKHVRVEQRGDVALVRIDRPPANALDLSLLDEGHGVLADLGGAEPGAVVLTGRDGFFSAGVDLKLVPTLDAAERLARRPSGPYAAAKAQLRGALPAAGADPLLERWL